MINGLQFRVEGNELITLIEQAAKFHDEKAESYAGPSQQSKKQGGRDKEAEPSRANQQGQESGQGQARNEADRTTGKGNQHSRLSSGMSFLAAHIQPNETYLLSASDLVQIGVLPRAEWSDAQAQAYGQSGASPNQAGERASPRS